MIRRACYRSLAYDTLAMLHFTGTHDSTSMLTLSLARASYPLHDRIAFISAPSDDKLVISSRYFIYLATASHSLQVIDNMDMWTKKRKSIRI